MNDWRRHAIDRIVNALDDDYGKGRGHCLHCGAQWDGYKICHCPTCHLTFTSVTGFDFHRIGSDDARRCRTPDELTEKGYQPDEHNRWRKPAPADLQSRFTKGRQA